MICQEPLIDMMEDKLPLIASNYYNVLQEITSRISERIHDPKYEVLLDYSSEGDGNSGCFPDGFFSYIGNISPIEKIIRQRKRRFFKSPVELVTFVNSIFQSQMYLLEPEDLEKADRHLEIRIHRTPYSQLIKETAKPIIEVYTDSYEFKDVCFRRWS